MGTIDWEREKEEEEEETENDTKMELKSEVKIILKKKLKDTLDWLTENYPEEISGWITGEITPEGIVLDEFLMPFQEISSVSVDTTSGDLIKLRKEYGKKCEKIMGHYHSHHSMGTFWSSTDDDFIEQHMKGRKMRIFLVGSTQGGTHYRVRLELREPFHISMDKLDYEVEKVDSPLGKELQSEIDKKVIKKTYSYESPVVYGNDSAYSIQDNISKTNEALYGRNLNQRKGREEEIDVESERVITQNVTRAVSIDTTTLRVTVADIDNDYFQEILRNHKNLNPQIFTGGLNGSNSLIFRLPSKKKAKRFYREVMNDLAQLMREDAEAEHNSSLLDYNPSRGHAIGTEMDYDEMMRQYGGYGNY